MTTTKQSTFYEVLTAAVNDIAEHGYDSQARIDYWTKELRDAAVRSMTPPYAMEELLNAAMRAVYAKLIDRGDIVKMHPGVSRYTIERIKPKLRAELDRRIMASANLIKLNRQASIDKTLQRFSGWSTSIPAGGSRAVDKGDVKTATRKALAQLPFEERRVLIDQGAKLTSSLSEIVATDGGAIAGKWFSHYREKGYNYREDHKERDGLVYLVRGSWAQNAGLVKPGVAGYTDQVTGPAVEVFCRCKYIWIYNLRDLPSEMLSNKGATDLARVRKIINA